MSIVTGLDNLQKRSSFILPLGVEHFRLYKKGKVKKSDLIDDKYLYITGAHATMTAFNDTKINTKLFFETGRVMNYKLVRLLILANMPNGIKMRDLKNMTGLEDAAIQDILEKWGAVSGVFESDPMKISRFNFIRANQFLVLPSGRKHHFLREMGPRLSYTMGMNEADVFNNRTPILYTLTTQEYIYMYGYSIYYINIKKNHIHRLDLSSAEVRDPKAYFGRVFAYYKKFNQENLSYDDLINLPKLAFHAYKDNEKYDKRSAA